MGELFLPILLVILALFLWFNFRRQKKAAAEQQEKRSNLTPGTRVQTTSGIFGSVVASGNSMIDLEIAPGVVVRWLAVAVREVLDDETAALTYPGGPFTVDEAAALGHSTEPHPDTEFDATASSPTSLTKPGTVEHDSEDTVLGTDDTDDTSDDDDRPAGPSLEK